MIGMAHDSGKQLLNLDVVEKLLELAAATVPFHLYVEGRPFKQTLEQAAKQLRDSVSSWTPSAK
jgi:hypothetical protein